MNSEEGEIITILEFYTRLIDYYYISNYNPFINNIKIQIQYEDYIKNVSYFNCVKGMLNLMPEYFYNLITVRDEGSSIRIIIVDPEIYSLLSLYLL